MAGENGATDQPFASEEVCTRFKSCHDEGEVSMFCPRCKAEYRPGFTRCSECDLPLVYRLPVLRQEISENEMELVVVRTYNNKLDADVARMTLEAAGIASMLRSEGVSVIRSFPFAREIELLVTSEDAHDADQILSLDLSGKES
jgi:Putative prokaryotic signal transducing protein